MVTDTYAYFNGTDPEFWIDEDIIECEVCGEKYDYKKYRSFTCAECEGK